MVQQHRLRQLRLGDRSGNFQHNSPGAREPSAGSWPARGSPSKPLPRAAVVPPVSLEPAFSTDPYDRAHTYGRSFRDLVRAFRRDYAHAPDLVAFPRDEGGLMSVLDWCSHAGVAAMTLTAATVR